MQPKGRLLSSLQGRTWRWASTMAVGMAVATMGRDDAAAGEECAGSDELPDDGEERQRIVAAAELLGQLLLQDVERAEGGVSLKDGVSRDRMMSVHDPEMRHGHKSSRRRFDGHKAAIVVDTDSQLITAVEVLPGNAPDNLGALEYHHVPLAGGNGMYCPSIHDSTSGLSICCWAHSRWGLLPIPGARASGHHSRRGRKS